MSETTPKTTPKPFVFVLMPFDEAFTDIYKFGIKGAADDVEAYAERLDEQMFTEGMLDRIFNQISRADVIVADMTGRNANVFYEVGYAHALGKIVLLLTQKADDIPFDLKQRAHTVYGGSIETLRKELAQKLRWAIVEARRGPRTGMSEAVSLRILDKDIQRGALPADNPEISGQVEGVTFQLPLQIRNDAVDQLSPITHVYLFTETDSSIVPCSFSSIDFTGSDTYLNVGPWLGAPIRTPQALTGFTANPLDCPDGLSKQFRLPTTFPGLPSGAVEMASIDFMFTEGATHNKAGYCLRLHTASQYHDFGFRLDIGSEENEQPSKSETPDDTQ